MIDQTDFAGIDEYIKRHGLNDASMAKERMARRYGVNDGKKPDGGAVGAENGDATGEEGQEQDGVMSELQKAEQQMQDEEDELEEDYDPSGGESEGEGEDSEEDEDGEGNGEGQYDEEEEDDEEGVE